VGRLHRSRLLALQRLMPRYRHVIEYDCGFAGGWGEDIIETDNPEGPSPEELHQMALEHFDVSASITDTEEIEDDD